MFWTALVFFRASLPWKKTRAFWSKRRQGFQPVSSWYRTTLYRSWSSQLRILCYMLHKSVFSTFSSEDDNVRYRRYLAILLTLITVRRRWLKLFSFKQVIPFTKALQRFTIHSTCVTFCQTNQICFTVIHFAYSTQS